jgi:hypothetical protein
MAYKTNNTVTIADDRSGSFANVTIQNNGFLEVNSSDGFQGTVAGYTSGGNAPSLNIIDKFPFSSDTNATDVGDLTAPRRVLSGQSSTTHGYTSGGFTPGQRNIIDKFPFAVDTNSSDVGDLTEFKSGLAGQSSTTHGYASGGFKGPPGYTNVIEKFPFAIDTNASDIGDSTTTGTYGAAGQSSTTHGYSSGGGLGPPNPTINVIEKFPFATDTNATDIGDLTQARIRVAGQSSITSGYTSGGAIPTPNTPPIVNTIEKFPFATDTNATDIGDLTQGRYAPAGQSSTASGYTSGGIPAPPDSNATNIIDKFPFTSDSNATDVGDLTVARRSVAGNQD